jgi:pimeloyl-ACP methyl ester carboxylesterase
MGGVHAARIAASGEIETRSALVMLHGIYGRGRNWTTIARAVVEARPDYACWLVDLPHHGDSLPGRHGDTVNGLAADVREWMDEAGVSADAILGHSYGGKIALALAAAAPAARLQVWLIDSTPDVRPPSGSAWDMLALVRRLPPSFASREEAAQAIEAGGYSPGVARWMASNLERRGDRFVWRLDFDVMERLLLDFFRTDLWHVVEHPSADHEIHVVKASQSRVLTDEAVRRIEAAAAASGRVHLHHRAGGHWIHTESPQAIVDLLVRHLPRR